MSKVRLNYLLDALIGAAFVISTLTGMAFLLMGSGGYQGGRNADFRGALLGLSRATWSDLHTWTSLVLVAGVLAHLVLHWRWIVCVTKRLLPSRQLKGEDARCEVPVQVPWVISGNRLQTEEGASDG
jgi:hypothetical protein